MELAVWRIAKYLGLAVFAAGLVGCLRPMEAERRQAALVRLCLSLIHI